MYSVSCACVRGKIYVKMAGFSFFECCGTSSKVDSPAELIFDNHQSLSQKAAAIEQNAPVSSETVRMATEQALSPTDNSSTQPEPEATLARKPHPAVAAPLSGEMRFGCPIEMTVPISITVDNSRGGSAPGITCDTTCEQLCLVQTINSSPTAWCKAIHQWNKSASEKDVVKKFDRICRVSANESAASSEDIKDALSSPGILTLSMEHPGELKISVEKNGGDLGLKCKQLSMKGLLIESIGQGIIKEMNESGAINPPMKPYDVICEINDKNSYSDEMLERMERMERFTIKVLSYTLC
eukprot:TRINITY_DN32233_c0_g1_i1.p1 TRINITY_DN32233_c0_g1~~TRINITY_DN32233_c0_g1_i1.p1  ORF type:complete len:297 (+),score=54.07 TRINITY_DN32233_c0_g1_i1:19-909(+)